MIDHKLIAFLASDESVARGVLQVAEQLRDRAQQIDTDGTFAVEQGWLVVNGLRRRVATVVNHAPDAAHVEFGHAGGGQTGLRPLGRAAESVKA